MTEISRLPDAGDSDDRPPPSFVEAMEIPDSTYRTAIAIKNAVRKKTVSVTFTLQDREGRKATYAAVCPRCQTGEIIAYAMLDANGKFAEPPACPTLCVDCEDRLDAILEPAPAKDATNNGTGRETMDRVLKGMKPSWE